jgi:thiamine biosynthesis protein ThiS
MQSQIQVVLNGIREKLPRGLTLTLLIRRFKEDDAHLIVERNGRFVYPRDYSTTRIEDGDEIEFINPNFGG